MSVASYFCLERPALKLRALFDSEIEANLGRELIKTNVCSCPESSHRCAVHLGLLRAISRRLTPRQPAH